MSQKTLRRTTRRQTCEIQETNSEKSTVPKAEETTVIEEEKCVAAVENNDTQKETIINNGESEPVANLKECEEIQPAVVNGKEPPLKEAVNGTETLNEKAGTPDDSNDVPPETEPEYLSKEEEEMDPLTVCNESDPELVFEESPDTENDCDFPVDIRCKTRRSLTRNIPTPSTPKLEQTDIPTEVELNYTFDSCENASTKAIAGGDSTRLNYTESSMDPSSNAFLCSTKGKTFGEALRTLSTRRSIRPLGYDYKRNMCEVDGKGKMTLKRKNGEENGEGAKRRRGESSPGVLWSKWTSPIREVFGIQELVSSTPKLTGYKDKNMLIEGNTQDCQVDQDGKRWCVIM